MTQIAPIKENYVNNRDLLREIHNSKNTFCYYTDDQYKDYDIIVDSVHESPDSLAWASAEQILKARQNRADRMQQEAFHQANRNFVISVLKKIKESEDCTKNDQWLYNVTLGLSDHQMKKYAPECTRAQFITLMKSCLGYNYAETAYPFMLLTPNPRIAKTRTKMFTEYLDSVRSEDLEKPKLKTYVVDPNSIALDQLIFRVHTFDHIPPAPGRKKNPKTVADTKAKVNFPPFKHFIFTSDNNAREVGRSHWKGDIDTGEFCISHGQITRTLGHMFLTLVNRYSHRSNWRGYTYVDEMRGAALIQLSHVGLQFNELLSENPFGYYTQAVSNCFTRVLNSEKEEQKAKDELLIAYGMLPSYSRQMAHEAEVHEARENAKAINVGFTGDSDE